MNHGFVRVACAAPNLRVADCLYNARQIAAQMRRLADEGAAVVVFPELSITGYTCGDLFGQQLLLEGAERALGEVLAASKGIDALVFVGLPVAESGKLYNCAAAFKDGVLLGLIPKSFLPSYGEFYEHRNFAPAFGGLRCATLCGQQVPLGTDILFECQTLPGLCVAAEICEDLWVPSPPSVSHAVAGATVIVNLSASDDLIGKSAYRHSLVQGQSARLACGYLYADAGFGESTTDMVFSGNCIIAENGTVLSEAAPFSGLPAVTELDVQRLISERRRMTTFPAAKDENHLRVSFSLNLRETPLTRAVAPCPFVPDSESEREARCEEILSIQAQGLRKRLDHTGAKTAVIGLSGGLDSTLALLVCARAMALLDRPASDIVALTMPCFGTTRRTKTNAERLAERVGAALRVVDITESVKAHFADLGHDRNNFNVVFENAQARERTQLLMDVANQTGGIVVGTGDLSELALGWATYNGDHMSMYGVNASIPKTLIRHLVRYEADRTPDAALAGVLRDVLDTPVSPELLPADNGEISQKTEGIVGPYELHDFFLFYAVRYGFSPAKILRLAQTAFAGRYDKAAILGWLRIFYRRFFSQQFKRSCLPDGPKVGTVTLSPRGDWRMPSDASAALWLEEIDRME